MTNSEAIAVLMEQKRYVHENSVPDQALDMGIKALKSERKKGKWIGKPIAGYTTVRCSVCRNVFMENNGRWNFCPDCGADMRGEEDDRLH